MFLNVLDRIHPLVPRFASVRQDRSGGGVSRLVLPWVKDDGTPLRPSGARMGRSTGVRGFSALTLKCQASSIRLHRIFCK